MVNLIMCVGGEETMSRSFMMKKYSHCPLKKRPVQIIKEEPFCNGYEPENLSTKPEDLSRKVLTPQPATAVISIKKLSASDTESSDSLSMYNSVAETMLSKLNGPLEPLNLNTSIKPQHEEYPMTWPRAVPAQYPPHYIPLNYMYPGHKDILPYYYPSTPPRMAGEILSPLPLESATSPMRHAFIPFQPRISPVIAALPESSPESRHYQMQAAPPSPLSPISTTSSNSYPYYASPSPPPATPEDLSSPGSVTSNKGSSGSDNAPKKKNKDCPDARHKCQFCSKSYSTYSGLSKHQQFHCTANEDCTLKKKFKCKSCGKEYNSLGALKMHIRTHTLPCKCKLCGKAFSRPWLLQGHIRTHTGEKPFSCQHCNRAFADRSNLRAHLQTHSDVKKYSCPTCSKTFSRMSLLSKHTDGGCTGRMASSNSVEIKTYYN